MDPIHLSDMIISTGPLRLRDLVVWAGPFSALAATLLAFGLIHSQHSRPEPLPVRIVRRRRARRRTMQKRER